MLEQDNCSQLTGGDCFGLQATWSAGQACRGKVEGKASKEELPADQPSPPNEFVEIG
jgi:hypothetical protein